MSDHRSSVKIEFTIYGQTFNTDMWINWDPSDDYGCDPRVSEWFADNYAKARAGYDSYRDMRDAEDEERWERQQLQQLKTKYEPGS